MDTQVFLTCEVANSIEKELTQGYRAFIISDLGSLQQILNEANSFLQQNPNELISFIVEQKATELAGLIKAHPINKFVALPEKSSYKDLENCKRNGKRLIIFSPEKTAYSFSFEQNICEYKVPVNFPADIKSGFNGNAENDLVIFWSNDVSALLPDSLNQHLELIPEIFNTYTGKLPNFYVTHKIETFNTYHQKFTSKKWYSAKVEYNGETLSGVSWEELPEMSSMGKIHTSQPDLSPIKEGFRFSPDIFNFNNQTSESTKIFYATRKDLMDEMVLLLDFNREVNNKVKSGTETSYSKIDYKNDASKGWCAVFNGRDHYIDFDTDISFHKNFTVSAWVNPTELKGNRSILGKGKALSVKIRDGNLLFTSPGIKDHFIDSAVVTLNEWQLLTYVISAGETVHFYRNGVLLGTQDAAPIMPTDHSLLIGTNLWDESFVGMMDDLAIWNRTLNDEEVIRLYNEGFEKNSKTSKYFLIWILLFILAAISYYLIFKRKKNKTRKFGLGSTSDTQVQKKVHNYSNEPYIELFGGFNIVNRNKENITTRFSPKRKQIFILVLIETLKEKGISSKQLTDKLWAGYSSESAKNNRSTQVQRIREIIKESSGISIDYHNKKWLLNFEEDVYCDLAQYFYLIEKIKHFPQNTFNSELLSEILDIIEKGTLLPNMDDEWLDNFKSEISDDLIETLLPLYGNHDFMLLTELFLRMSNALLIFDSLNETILSHKINALIKLGKTTQAQETLEHFEKVYHQCYAQPFGKSIADLVD